jgi:protease I
MKIACVLAKDFEDSEFKEPYDALRAAGHEVTVVGLKAQEELEGDKGKVRMKTDRAFADVRPDDFDALFIPGGYSPDKLRAHDEPVRFARAFVQTAKPILAICHGPQLLLTANESGKWNHRMTAWKTVQGDLKKAGADVVDQEVVVDRNLVTSRMPKDIPAFIRESLKVLERVPART